MNSLDGKKVKIYLPGSAARHRGVISGAPLCLRYMVAIKTELKRGKVLDAKCITSKRNGERAETLSIQFNFPDIAPNHNKSHLMTLYI